MRRLPSSAPLLIALSSALLGQFAAARAYACSIYVNQNYQKQLLVGYFAGEMGVNLAQATSIRIEEYAQSFTGGSSGAACPTRLHTRAFVTISYRKNKFVSCQVSGTILRSEQIGEELEPGPFQTAEVQTPASSCSSSLIPFPR